MYVSIKLKNKTNISFDGIALQRIKCHPVNYLRSLSFFPKNDNV